MVVGIAAAGGIGGAVGLLAIGATVARRYDEPGTDWFVGYAALVGLGVGVVSAAVAAGYVPVTDFTGRVGRWLTLAWILPAGLWTMFALRYTGRFVGLTGRTAGLIVLPLFVFLVQILLSATTETPPQLLGFLGIGAGLYALVLSVTGMVLLVRATHQYDHVTVWQGIALAVSPAIPWLLWTNLPYIAQLGQRAGATAYVLGSIGSACGLGLAVFRLDTFTRVPAVGVVGERDVVNETDDLVVVADDESRVVRANESARAASEVPASSAGPVTVRALLGYGIDELRRAETVELDVAGTSAKYDPQVSTVVDEQDRQLGTVASLRDVTERELRKERLAVLNRVLRHNLRNQLDVANAHIEAIDHDRADSLAETMDRIAVTSDRARTIDRLLSETREPVSVDVAELLRDTVATHDRSIAVDTPDSLCLTVDRAALEAAVRSAVDNAVTHATDVTVAASPTRDGCELRIVDDGPGIPASELSALEAGTEEPLRHGSGLGLWQLTWATRTLGGDVSFDTSDGTTVTITVPDRASSRR
jgi:signal transduction histidine kinase